MSDTMKAFVAAILCVGAIILLSLSRCGTTPATPTPAAQPIEVYSGPVLDEAYVHRLMETCGTNLSEITRKARVSYLMQVGEKYFSDLHYRKWFYYVPCIENNFGHTAKSKAGAVGMMQVMPKFAQEFANKCNLGKVTSKDLEDIQVNILVGACQFKHLVEYYKGDMTLTLAAYNSGQDSPTVKRIISGDVRNVNTETQGYLAAAFVLDTRMNKATTKEKTDASK